MASARRRDVLRATGAAALGITATSLPDAAVAASPVPPGSVQLDATTVTLTPSGWGSTGSTGALGVSWTAVEDADSYTVWARTGTDEFAQQGGSVTGLTAALSGLAAGVAHDVQVVAASTDPAFAPSTSATVTANSSVATGGSIGTYADGDTTYVVHAFKHSGPDAQATRTFSVHRAVAVDHLVVAGGGGGGGDVGGGGGAGGLITTVTTTRGAGTGAVTRAVGDHTIVIGAGGAAGANATDATGRGGDGAASSAFGTVNATGGGGGGTWTFDAGAASTPGRAGGSGGGGGGKSTGSGNVGGSGVDGEGTAGGDGFVGPHGGGGGGGAGGAGTTATSGTAGAPGGPGLAVPILDAVLAAGLGVGVVWEGGVHNGTVRDAGVYFAGGGGAGAGDGIVADGPGGLGGGGLGRARDALGASGAGVAATGGGGGGPGGPHTGAAGGSGVVVLRYELPA